MSKLGTVDISDRIKAGMKHYERLEGVRKGEKLVEEATQAYLKVITTVLDKDPVIQAELAEEQDASRRKRGVKTATGMAPASEDPTPTKVA